MGDFTGLAVDHEDDGTIGRASDARISRVGAPLRLEPELV